MSDDEADPELLELLRQSLGLGADSSTAVPSTGVLKDAEYICDNSIDVAISPQGTKDAAESVWRLMQKKQFSTLAWSEHELHPKSQDEQTVNFIFTMNLLNFSFWSDLPSGKRFAIDYRSRKWTGYWSLIAALQRALEEGHPITSPSFWTDPVNCPDSLLEHIFRSCTPEPIPLLADRIVVLREAGVVLEEHFDGTPLNLVQSANQSAARLVNILADHFLNLRDVTTFHGKSVRLLKRAQILVADLWACFDGQSYGEFHDIDALTMFADYRIPQMLYSLGVLIYSPRLESLIKRHVLLQPGSVEEVEIRGCSIWAVEMLRRQILKAHPEAADMSSNAGGAKTAINAVLIDFFLYDTCKEKEVAGEESEMLTHHRTRSIFY